MASLREAEATTPSCYRNIAMKVLDHGFVELEESMGGDAAVIRAARICYQSEGTPKSDEQLINRLMTSEPKHNTVFEHSVFRWYVKCPLFVSRQWLRHRIGSFNEKSLRYCTASRECYMPKPTSRVGYGRYGEHIENSFDLYEELVEDDWPKEQARGVLPLCIYTEFIWTVNAWSLMNWLTKRLDKGAQWEHRQYAKAVLVMFEEVMPITAKAFRGQL